MANRIFKDILIVIIILSTAVVVGCSSVQSPIDSQIDAIIQIQQDLTLPVTTIEFIEITTMINSPNGNLEVAKYKDSDGRLYYVNPDTNQVVEIDARMFVNIPPNTPILSMDELKSRAMEIATATISDFDLSQSSWDYQEGVKGENYFFTWYGEMPPNVMNRPFAQIGLNKGGTLFAYYNTLSFQER